MAVNELNKSANDAPVTDQRPGCEDMPAPGDDGRQYLFVPPGRYKVPTIVFPIDLRELQRLLPGSEIRRRRD